MEGGVERLFGVFLAIFLFCSIVNDFSPGYSWAAIITMLIYAAWKAYEAFQNQRKQP